MERRLGELRAGYGASRIYSGWTLVEGRDEATLAEALAAAPDLAQRVRRLSPSVALADRADADALESVLRRRGLAV